MEISYSLNEQDYIDFNLYHINHSDTLKKSLMIQRYVLPLIFFIIPFVATRVTDIPLWYWTSVSMVAIVVWMIFYPRYFKWEISKRLVKMLKEGKNDVMLGHRSLSLTSQGIIEHSVGSESKTSWDVVGNIYETKDYLFIYISSVSAYIVPIRIFESMEHKEKFLKEIDDYKAMEKEN
ncbi:YcxB family protein [Irregularibacter muris]|uniref:YcxB family protein n=1 Tax=Irregularibacter muris TaxID=1796619 RepID=A0AAE3L3A3_9FIRM|nr:YcxB family protein [Irregularibacter muris]MCR1900119.1 YcxB family protein [Irregularibacter muris]